VKFNKNSTKSKVIFEQSTLQPMAYATLQDVKKTLFDPKQNIKKNT
jgi:hypothetical protein